MMQVLMVLWIANRKVYGSHQVWKAARRAGHDIGRDQGTRLMRELDIRGMSRRRNVFATPGEHRRDATRQGAQLVQHHPFFALLARRYRRASTLVTALRSAIDNPTSPSDHIDTDGQG